MLFFHAVMSWGLTDRHLLLQGLSDSKKSPEVISPNMTGGRRPVTLSLGSQLVPCQVCQAE
jgi:hypothetical protein